MNVLLENNSGPFIARNLTVADGECFPQGTICSGRTPLVYNGIGKTVRIRYTEHIYSHKVGERE